MREKKEKERKEIQISNFIRKKKRKKKRANERQRIRPSPPTNYDGNTTAKHKIFFNHSLSADIVLTRRNYSFFATASY